MVVVCPGILKKSINLGRREGNNIHDETKQKPITILEFSFIITEGIAWSITNAQIELSSSSKAVPLEVTMFSRKRL